jgi:hypothetical protein
LTDSQYLTIIADVIGKEQEKIMTTKQALLILKSTGGAGPRTPIKVAYRQAAQKYHPDVNPNGSEVMKAINAAFETLQSNFNI